MRQKKRCTKCDLFLPMNQFHLASDKPDGRYPQCKSCRRTAVPKCFIEQDKKRCLECKLVLPIDQFSKHAKRVDGRQKSCKACTKAYKARHYAANWKEILAQQRKYRLKHPERVRSVQYSERRDWWKNYRPRYRS